ncbi:MAG: Gmad2 immunoglobulin-like domain-containing protein [bacterium]
MSENWTPEDEDRLRRALHDEVSHVMPSSGGLERIMARTRQESPRPWWLPGPAVIGVAAALLAAIAVIGVSLTVLRGPDETVTAGTADSPSESTADPSPTTTPEALDTTLEPAPEPDSPAPTTSSRPPAPTQEAGTAFSGAVAVYYLTDTPAGPRLVREWRHLADVRDAATAALRLMLEEPRVDGYRTPWWPDTEVRSVRVGDESIDVDLSLPARTPVPTPSEDNQLAVQQLVYTATAAASIVGDEDDGSLPVRILVDGEQVDRLWGVDVSEPLTRAPADSVRQFVQLNEPAEGAEVTSPVEVSGEALVFEATLLWEVRQDGEVVAEDSTMTEEGLAFSPFGFEVDLDPGEYTLIVREVDVSDGEGREPMTDERSFTVTGD